MPVIARSLLVSSVGLVLALLVFGAGALPAGGSSVDPPVTCSLADAKTGDCQVGAEDPGEPEVPGEPGSGGAGEAGDGPGQPRVCRFVGAEVPCVDEYGNPWLDASQCYLGSEVLDPDGAAIVPAISQAEFDAEALAGRAPRVCLDPDWTTPLLLTWVWSDGVVPVDPEVLAQQAVSQLDVSAVGMGLAPRSTADDPGSLGLVGLPVHMWAAAPDASTMGPITSSASAGAVTVTATARVDRVEWSMGDGTTVTCTGPGTPYAPVTGAAPSPDCGHVYDVTSASQGGGAFPVTATSFWVVEWAGGGQSGEITFELSDTEQVRIGESQVIVTRN